MAMALLTHTAAATTTSASTSRPQLTSLAPTTTQPQSSRWNSAGFGGGMKNRAFSNGRKKRLQVSMAALPDPHSFAFLAFEWFKLTDLTVRVDLNPAREIIIERSSWAPDEAAIKGFYMAFALVFCWGCCVFGSMNDDFYDSEQYRKAGGNGTGHWLYEEMEKAERAARDEMWAEDLLKEIEEKAEEVRKAEEDQEKEKEVELV